MQEVQRGCVGGMWCRVRGLGGLGLLCGIVQGVGLRLLMRLGLQCLEDQGTLVSSVISRLAIVIILNHPS